MVRAPYEFTRGLEYPAIVATSEKIAWTVDEIFRGRRFDASGPIVPSSWLGTETLGFLTEQDQLTLNHCRAFSYAHLLGSFEEFLPAHLAGIAQVDWHDQRSRLRELFRFADEEMKHQELLRRTEITLEESCGHPFERHFDHPQVLADFTSAMLSYPALPRFLIVLALEWGTQRHYVDSVRDQTSDPRDALYADVLKAHWIEEAQHTKCDMLEIAQLAATQSAEQLSRAFDDLLAIGGLVDATFRGQAAKEVHTLEGTSARTLAEGERAVLRDTLHGSLSAIMAGSGLTHPNFVAVALALSPSGAKKLGIEVAAS
jgi:hypothetical protein